MYKATNTRYIISCVYLYNRKQGSAIFIFSFQKIISMQGCKGHTFSTMDNDKVGPNILKNKLVVSNVNI